MMNKPLVSVIFPAYNAERTIKEAIDSIIAQTYDNWELLAIDDGSIDRTSDIIKSYSDPRVKYIKNESNMGLIKTLNRGLDLCAGTYIARMDSDDICEPERFAEQVSFLEANKDYVVCGSAIKMFGSKNGIYQEKIVVFGSDDKDLKNRLILEPCFAHPAVMMRKSVFTESGLHYSENYDYAEDYRMWIDLMGYGKFYNFDKVLLNYRLSDTQMTQVATMVHPSIPKCRWEYIKSMYGDNVYSILKDQGISVRTLKQIRGQFQNKFFLEVLYLSMGSYSLSTLVYYFISKDYKILGWGFVKRLINRIFNNKPSKL